MQRTLAAFAPLLGYRSHATRLISSVAVHSREVEKNSLFFALSGKRTDGHYYLGEVAARGALGAVVSSYYRGNSHGLELFYVEDVLKALQECARRFLAERAPHIIGVTGTVGKTTTKEFLATLLSERYSVAKTPSSCNSQVGLPLTLLNRDETAEMLVLEMGMSASKELARLAQIAPPHIGVLTRISLAHAAFFSSLEEIAAAKCELFHSKRMERGFFPLEAERFPAVASLTIPKSWFDKEGAFPSIPSPFSAPHLSHNFHAACAVASHLGLTEEELKRGAQKLRPFNHRFQQVEKRGVCFIDDSYNSSPAAVTAALTALPKGKRVIALLGEMQELGAFSEKAHLDVAQVALSRVDQLLCLGSLCVPMVELFHSQGKAAQLFNTKKEALEWLQRELQEEDVVLIKGANSLRLWTLLEEL